MALLFDKNLKTINEHIVNIYKEHELEKISTIRKFRIVLQEGKRSIEREIEHYNLDLIISIGYRVNSKTWHTIPPVGHPTLKRLSGTHKIGRLNMDEILIYKSPEHQTEVEVQFDGETVWLNRC